MVETVLYNLTRNCNLRCTFCSVAAGIPLQNELTTEQISDSFVKLKEMGTKTIILMGGEPFMKLRIMDLIEYASKLFDYVHIETNGMILPINFIDFIKERGISNLTIFVSIEDAKSEYNDNLRGSGHLEQSIITIKKLKQSGIPVAIRSTLFADNDYKGLITLAKGLGVNIIFVRFLQQGRGKVLDLMPNKEILKEVYEIVKNNGNVQISDCPYYIYDTELLYKFKSKFKQDGGICQVLRKARIIVDSDGAIYPCVMLLEKKYKLGNILKDNKEKIEERYDKLLNEWKNLKVSDSCMSCKYFEFCQGGCYWLHKENKLIGDPSCSIDDKIKKEDKMEEPTKIANPVI